MAQTIGPIEGVAQVVWTATAPGIYVFVQRPAGGALGLNGQGFDVGSGVFIGYLETDDNLTYSGLEAQLSGVRLGDELSDPE